MEVNRRDPGINIPSIPKGMVKKIILGLAALLVIILLSTMVYTVEEQEHAAVLTFGRFTDEIVDAGLHFKAPFPFQKVIKVPAKITQKIEVGFRTDENGNIFTVEDEALMITGDENIVHADAIVEWRIGDVKKYLYNISNGEEFLRNATVASIRSVIGSAELDYAITEGKTEIEAKSTDLLLELQERYETGIHVIALRFQDIEPPSGEVEAAFKAVTDAREEKNTKINVARRYENDRIPKARGEAQALLEAAEADKQDRINAAVGDVAKFTAIYTEYLNNPSVTEYRLVVETLEKIYPNAKVFITNDNGDVVQYLPLNELIKSSAGGE